jgi:hypothetical protein
MPKTPEDAARQSIDRQLDQSGWPVQDYRQLNITAAPGVAVREFPLSTGHADYLAEPGFVAIVLNSPPILDTLDELKTGISDSGVNLTQKRFLELKIPVPSLEEQAQIVADVAERLSQIEAAEIAIDHALLRAVRLCQSILKQALEGKLVPQDPSDVAASVLLERIRDQKPGEPTKRSYNGNRSRTNHSRRSEMV